MIEILFSIFLAGLFIILCSGAWLMIQDSNIKHDTMKKISKKYPNLTRTQIKVLTYHKLREMAEKEDDK